MKLIQFILILFIFIGCNKDEKISQETIKTHMNFLASDELKGRSTFDTETMKKVEEYIISVYKENGLKAFPKYPEYLHRFNIKKIKVLREKTKITFNKKQAEYGLIANSNYEKKFKTFSELKKEFTVHNIGRNSKLNEAFSFSRKEGKHLVLIDKTHAGNFQRLVTYLNRDKTEIGEKEKTVILYIIKPS